MKNIKIILIFCIAIAGFWSCNERFETVNTNPNGISDVDPSHIFAKAAIAHFRSGVNGYDYRVGGQLSHFYVGVNAERFIDTYEQDLSGSSYESLYNTGYKDLLRYYNEIMILTGPGAEKENALQYAVADVMAVLAYAKLTDAYGSIPYSEGGFGNLGILSPSYDDQEDIYEDMISRLTSDITALKSADGSVGLIGQDPVFSDNPDLWLRFANSLRLRLAMRIRHVAPQEAANVITASLSEALLENNDHNAVQVNLDGDNSQLFSPWFSTFDFYKFRISDKVIQQLTSTDDPRLSIYATTMSNGGYKGFVNGLVEQRFAQEINKEHSFPGDYLVGKAAPNYLMTAAEIAFLQAESALFGLGGSNANEHYRRGITLSLERVGVPFEEIVTFLASPTATLTGTTEEQFEQISTQAWLAFAPNLAEAYSNMRRTGYPVIPQRDGITTSKGDTDGELPSRILYPLNERLTNETNLNEAIQDMEGGDELTSRVWWDIRR